MYDNHPFVNNASYVLLRYIFGDLAELMHLLAPDGWENSPYMHIHHPTIEQQYAELVRMNENMNHWIVLRNKGKTPPKLNISPSFEEFRQKQHADRDPIKPLQGLLYVYGGAVWSVFSNNHKVVGLVGEPHDFGSFRSSGTYLAEFLETTYPDAPTFDYVDFYCADGYIEDRADVTPIYELIFQRLRVSQCDWLYSFPRLYAVDFSDINKDEPDDLVNYDPNKTLADEAERARRQEENHQLQQQLGQATEEDKEEARYRDPPIIVQAYLNVYSRYPKGWLDE